MFMKTIIVLFIFSCFLLISCGNQKNEVANNVMDRICQIFTNDFNESKIIEAKEHFNSEFAEKFSIDNQGIKEYLVMLRPCFANTGYTKQIKPLLDEPMTGSVSKYLKLKESVLLIELTNEVAPAFNVKIQFETYSQRRDTGDYEIGGSLVLFDDNKEELENFSIYPVSDFYNSINAGKGDFRFTTYLDAIWYPYDAQPFDKAVEVFALFKRAEYYLIILNIAGEENEQEKKDTDKQFHEMIDKLEIMTIVPN